jgi:hypothetical protein
MLSEKLKTLIEDLATLNKSAILGGGGSSSAKLLEFYFKAKSDHTKDAIWERVFG